VTAYITEQELLDYIKSPVMPSDNSVIIDAIDAASREIDGHCGRYFFQQQETQYFSADPRDPSCLWLLPLDDMDLATVTGLVVRSETSNDGLYPTAWTINVDFICEPINQSQGGITGWPYTKLRAIGGKVWPLRFIPWQRDTVQIQGTWGWPAVPGAVKQACKILTAQSFKLGEAALGVAGFGEFGFVRVRDIPRVEKILQPYVKTSVTYGVA
jgi:hypothetical protein